MNHDHISVPFPNSFYKFGKVDFTSGQRSDYSPFGVQLSGRNFVKSGAKEGRFGFNGMEEDDEVKGDGNSYDYGARMLDPRFRRWLTIDPIFSKFADLSPYNFVGNSPILFIDPDEKDLVINYDTGKKDYAGNAIMDSYQYGSGMKVPNDRFVRQTVRTLNRLKSKGNDPLGIIDAVASAGTVNVAIKKGTWDKSSYIVSPGEMTVTNEETGLTKRAEFDENEKVFDIVSWHPKSGLISPDGKVRQSPANALIHELGHNYYNQLDPYGKIAEYDKILEMTDEEAQAKAIEEFRKKEKEECRDYDDYDDMWVIKEVESKLNEAQRNTHRGYLMKTIGGTFSTKGRKLAKGYCEGSVSSLKRKGFLHKDHK